MHCTICTCTAVICSCYVSGRLSMWFQQALLKRVGFFFSEDAEVQRKKKVTRQRKKAFMIALGAIGGGALIGMHCTYSL